MSLLSGGFLALLCAAWVAHALTPRRVANGVLIAASLLFYGWVHPWFPLVLLGSAVGSWAVARRIERDPAHKLAWLRLGLAGSALCLIGFRAAGYFAADVTAGFAALGLDPDPAAVRFVVPLGLSFYTLQHVSYPIDVYWGKVKARHGLLDWLAFATFLPLLVAGPIERAGRMLPQFERDRVLTAASVRSGLTLALWGLFQKVVIADTLAPYVNAVLGLEHPAPIVAWAGAAGFLVQMLADFGGYANIARGVARIFGFDVIQNFRHPYLSRTPSEFWTRWHISLSEWLRDYIFFPMYRSTLARRWLRLPSQLPAKYHDTVRATIATMLVSGLWHGTGWNFLLWGLLWAALLIGQQVLGPRLRSPPAGVQIAAMIGLNLLAHLIFTEPSPGRLLHDLTSAPWAGSGSEQVVAFALAAFTGAAALTLTAAWLVEERLAKMDLERRLPLETVGWTVAAALVFVFSRVDAANFVYQQF